jgi:hypothetical protein
MTSMIMPTTPEDLIVFLEQHNLEGTITDFETSSPSELTKFGLPFEVTIKLTMSCHYKDDLKITTEIIR